MRELNLGEKVYYIDRQSCKIRTATIIKKTVETSIDSGDHRKELSYLIKDVATATVCDMGNVLTSTSNWVNHAFANKEDLINYLTSN